MKTFKIFILLLASSLMLTSICCKKDHADCYDEQLYQQHKNDVCLQDCPGVIGCDGKNYCNECIANSLGIRVR